jgi:hypothetical protein
VGENTGHTHRVTADCASDRSATGLIHAQGRKSTILFFFIIIFIPSPRLSLLHWEERAMRGGDEDDD